MKNKRIVGVSNYNHVDSRTGTFFGHFASLSYPGRALKALVVQLVVSVQNRLSLKFALLVAFVVFSILPVLILTASLASSVSKYNEDTIKHARAYLAEVVGLSVSQKISSLNNKFLTLIVGVSSETEKEYSSLPSEFNWFAIADTTNVRRSRKVGSLKFRTVLGDMSSDASLISPIFRQAFGLALANPESIIYSNRVANTSGTGSVFILRSNASKTELSIAELPLDTIDSIRKNIVVDKLESITIIDGNGLALSQTGVPVTQTEDSQTVRHSSTHLIPLAFSESGLIRNLIRGHSGAELYHSRAKNVEMLAGYSSVQLSPLSSWGVIVSRPSVNIDRSAEAISNAGKIAILSALLLSVFFSYLIVKFILRPFDFLAKIADSCASDTQASMQQLQDLSCDPGRKDLYFVEVKQLVGSFKKLNTELVAYHDRMEAKVEERKKALDLESKENERVAKQLGYSTFYDSLTKLPNANLFNERLKTACQLSNSKGSKFGVVVINVIGIELSRNKYGNIVGDSVLKSAAKYLQNCLGEDVGLARTRANEFAALIMNIDSPEQMIATVHRLRNLNMKPEAYLDKSVSSTLDIDLHLQVGFSMTSEDTYIADTLLTRARGSVVRESSALETSCLGS